MLDPQQRFITAVYLRCASSCLNPFAEIDATHANSPCKKSIMRSQEYHGSGDMQDDAPESLPASILLKQNSASRHHRFGFVIALVRLTKAHNRITKCSILQARLYKRGGGSMALANTSELLCAPIGIHTENW